jgi:hypothetical protein
MIKNLSRTGDKSTIDRTTISNFSNGKSAETLPTAMTKDHEAPNKEIPLEAGVLTQHDSVLVEKKTSRDRSPAPASSRQNRARGSGMSQTKKTLSMRTAWKSPSRKVARGDCRTQCKKSHCPNRTRKELSPCKKCKQKRHMA